MVRRLVAFGLAVLVAAGPAGCGLGGRIVDGAVNGLCPETARISQGLVDRLRPAGFELAGAKLYCTGDLSEDLQDFEEIWFSASRTFPDRRSVVTPAAEALLAAGWTTRANQAHREPAEEAIDVPSPALTIATGSYRLELWGWSSDPALLWIVLTNDALDAPDPGAAGSGGLGRLPDQEISQVVADHYSLAPVPGLPPVPAGFRAWLPRNAALVKREYSLEDLAGRRDVSLTVGVAAEGLDPALTCGILSWSRQVVGDGGCRPLGTTPTGDQVYLPIRRKAGEPLSYGPPMTLHGSTVLILSEVVLPPGDVTVDGQPAQPHAQPPRAHEMTREQVLALLGSVRL